MNALKKRKHERGRPTWDVAPLIRSAIDACSEPANLDEMYQSWKEGIKVQPLSPSEFSSGSSYFEYAQAAALFRKRPSQAAGGELQHRAISGLLRDEKINRITSRRIDFYARNPDRMRPLVRRLLWRARDILHSVMGEVGEGTLGQMYMAARPGSGTSVGTRLREWTSPEFKYGPSTRPVVTPGAFWYVPQLIEGYWNEVLDGVPVELSVGNKVACVPKDAFTHRTIAIEPSLNVHLQVGIGVVISSRLKHAGGPDIHSQLANQKAAREGASTWEERDPWCTIDLKSASNRLTLSLVRFLWPRTWSALFEDLRSPCGLLPDGTTINYSMLSSMGNGFTFPVQTATFWALAQAAQELTGADGDSIVYGDDIIVRRCSCLLLLEVLRFCGFEANTDKTFVFGPFRESCGDDWYSLLRVTPCYIRGVPDEATYYRVANTYPTRCSTSETRAVLRATGKACRYVLRGPEDPDNPSGHLWSARYPRKWVSDWQCYSYKTLLFRPKIGRGGGEEGQYCAWLARRTRKGSTGTTRTFRGPRGHYEWVEQALQVESGSSPALRVRRIRPDGSVGWVVIDRDKAAQRGLGSYRVVTAYTPA